MAQSRKRRQTKHRGNAAGMVESRGRTGRKPGEGEKSSSDPKELARQKRLDRMNRPPSWRGAFNRAAFAALFLLVIALLVLDQDPATAASLAAVALLAYIPMSYYTDLFIYRRRMRGRAAKG